MSVLWVCIYLAWIKQSEIADGQELLETSYIKLHIKLTIKQRDGMFFIIFKINQAQSPFLENKNLIQINI